MEPAYPLAARGTLEVYVRLPHPNSRCRAEVLEPREVEAHKEEVSAHIDGAPHTLYIVTLREVYGCGLGDVVRTPAGQATFFTTDPNELKDIYQTIQKYFDQRPASPAQPQQEPQSALPRSA